VLARLPTDAAQHAFGGKTDAGARAAGGDRAYERGCMEGA